jgi:hypothetical protein
MPVLYLAKKNSHSRKYSMKTIDKGQFTEEHRTENRRKKDRNSGTKDRNSGTKDRNSGNKGQKQWNKGQKQCNRATEKGTPGQLIGG